MIAMILAAFAFTATAAFAEDAKVPETAAEHDGVAKMYGEEATRFRKTEEHKAMAHFAASSAATPPPAALELLQDPRDAETIVGRVGLAAAPAVVWERLRRVDRWRELFSDVRKLDVTRHDGDVWVVRLDSAILSCGPHDYVVHFRPGRTAALRIDAPGIDAGGTLSATPAATGTRFEYRLRVHVGRMVGWFLSENDIRGRQRRLVAAYLTDLARAFGSLP